jgi:hypothetical protein
MRVVSCRRALAWALVLLWGGLAGCESSAPSPVPDRIVLLSPVVPTASVGAVVGAPLIAILDVDGRAIRNLPFTVSIEGGGTLGAGARRTTAASTAFGLWTLGPNPGTQALTVSSAGLAPLRITIDAIPGAPASATPIGSTSGFSAPPESLLAGSFGLIVRDAFGNLVPGVPVTVEVSGGGAVPSLSLITDGAGRAEVASWRLGPSIGVQALTLRVSGLAPVQFVARAEAPFTIELRYVGALPSQAVRDAFARATERISALITADISPWTLTNFAYATQCDLPGAAVLDGEVDDLVVYVAIQAIDGPGQTVGLGGPCIARPGSLLPIAGDVIFDSADLPTLLAAGQFDDVVLHELLHVVGIGTIWGPAPFGLDRVTGVGTADPRFVGAGARSAYAVAGGVDAAAGVPVENVGGPRTREAHWRETVMGAELMTGQLAGGVANPLSAISIAALGDLGYTVDLRVADPFRITAGLGASRAAAVMTGGPADTRPLRYVAVPGGGVVRFEPAR